MLSLTNCSLLEETRPIIHDYCLISKPIVLSEETMYFFEQAKQMNIYPVIQDMRDLLKYNKVYEKICGKEI